jgi:hypothetical protein
MLLSAPIVPMTTHPIALIFITRYLEVVVVVIVKTRSTAPGAEALTVVLARHVVRR